MASTTTGAHEGTGRKDPLGTVGDFLPWVLYWVLVGNVSFRASVLVTLAVAAAVLALHRAADGGWRTLPVGSFVVFSVLAVLAFVVSDAFLARWMQPLSNLGLTLVVVGGMAVGRPFTLDYARESVSPAMAASRGFLWVNQRLSAVWAVAFVVMTASSFVPPVVEGDATIHDGGRLLSVLGYWIVPYGALAVAGLVSMALVKGMDGPAATESAPGRGLPDTSDPATVDGVSLVVSDEAPADAPLPVRVEGVTPGEVVALRVTLVDALDRRFVSRARFRATGEVVDAGDPPEEGSDWSGPDAAAPVWSATWDEEGPADLFLPPWGPARARVEVEVGGRTLARTVVRQGLAAGVEVLEVAEDGLTGRAFLPARSGAPGPAVVLVGGSEGGVDSMSSMGGLLASHGIAALVVGLFGAPGLPPDLVEVPLEPVEAGWSWLGARPAVDSDRVAVLGLSRGAEAVLAAVAASERLRPSLVVGLSPGSVVWEALDAEGTGTGRSSWTVAGAPLPWVAIDDVAVTRDLLAQSARRMVHRHLPQRMHLRAAYEGGLASPEAAAARVPVERIQAPVVLHAGGADALWPSDLMGREILDRRRAAGTGADDHLVVHPGAGHLLRFPLLPVRPFELDGMAFGGSAAEQAAAQAALAADLVERLGGPRRDAEEPVVGTDGRRSGRR